MSSANPANPLTRTEFYNACTSVLHGLTILQNLHSSLSERIVDDRSMEVLDKLGIIVTNLKHEVERNKEFYIDGPLVRFLTAQVSKAKGVIQEMKRTCSPESLSINGQEYIVRHLRQHIHDIGGVIEELSPFNKDVIFKLDTALVDKEIQDRLGELPVHFDVTYDRTSREAKQTPPSRKTNDVRFEETTNRTQIPTGASRRSPWNDEQPKSAPRLKEASFTLDDMTKPPGVFEHLLEMTNNQPKHSPNWPKYQAKVPNLLERTRPPLVHNGLRDMQNYRNMPQFTGTNLPLPQLPDGEYGHRATHVPHWDHYNNRMY